MLRATLLLLVLSLAACAPWGGDDDDLADDDDLFSDDDDATADDDDATADDDDATSDPVAPVYAEDEAWFALTPGNAWIYTETVATVPDATVDDVFVRVGRRVLASSLPGSWSPELVGLEVIVDRVFGDDEVHWVGLSGTGVAVWLGSEVQSGFETDVIEGDGGTILRREASLDDLADATFSAAWMLADEAATDVEAIATGEAPYTYEAGPEEGVDCLETTLERNGSGVGFQYWKPEWGLLGMSVEVSSGGRTWEITACSACPVGSGLPSP
jgi:hypothetical protein